MTVISGDGVFSHDGTRARALLIDQGDADQFLAEQRRLQLFEHPCADADVDRALRVQPGYDHSYSFISTFMADHLAWNATRLER